MIHRRLAVATRVAKLVSAARFPNQYFVGCACCLGHSISSHCSGNVLRQRFAALELPVRLPDPYRRKTGCELLFRAVAPKDGLPSREGEARCRILGGDRLVVRRALAKFRRQGFLSRRRYGQHRLNAHHGFQSHIQPPCLTGLGGTWCRCRKPHRRGQGPGERHWRLPVEAVRRR